MSVFKGIIKSRIHTGTFKTQSVINRFDNTKSADCMPCHESIEDYRHFLLHCNSLSNISKIHQNKLTEYMKENQINYNYVSRSEEESLKLAIDCSTFVSGKRALDHDSYASCFILLIVAIINNPTPSNLSYPAAYPEIMGSLLICISKMAVSSSQKFLQRFHKEIFCSGVRAFFWGEIFDITPVETSTANFS